MNEETITIMIDGKHYSIPRSTLDALTQGQYIKMVPIVKESENTHAQQK